jgi:hypothetical protein
MRSSLDFCSVFDQRYHHSTFCSVLDQRSHHSTFLGGQPPTDFFFGSSCLCDFLIDSAVSSLAFSQGLVSSRTARCAFLKEKGPSSSVKSVILVPPLGAPLTPTSDLCWRHVGVKPWASRSGSTRVGRSEQSGWHQVRPKLPSQPGDG